MIDTVKLDIKAGDGGNGCTSFLREKYKPNGGPDGGDGGAGGSAYIVGDPSLNTLLHLKFTSTVYVDRGRHGRGKNQTGGKGDNKVIAVPLGTEIRRIESKGETVFVGDIVDSQPVLVAQGGRGGWGNTRYVSATNQEPVLSQRGEAGERVILLLELKLLADVGLLARPNAGKSTLISRCSAAKPRVADYPFTTVEPVLGMVAAHGRDFVMMEIPGLLEGAHRGVGLGYEFLRHAERARVYVHLLDGLSEDPVADFDMLNRELEQFSPAVAAKPQVVVINKVDVTGVRERRDALTDVLRQKTASLGGGGEKEVPVFWISAVTGEGVDQMLGKVVQVLAAESNVKTAEPVPLHPAGQNRVRKEPIRVTLEEGVYIVHSADLERLVAMADTRDRRFLLQLWQEMGRQGVAAKLEEAGIEAGSTIRIGRSEIEWF